MIKERELLQKVVNHMWQGELVDEIKELLAQPESTAEAIMPNGVCVSNVYAAYEEGRKSVMSEQEPVAWKDRTYGNLHHVDYGNSIPLYISPPKREPLSDGEIRDGLDGKNGFENWYDDRFVDGVRFAEKHHGIGGRL